MKRSFHFIPGDKPHYFEKINFLSADWYIFDLEDAVSEENKDTARVTVYSFLKDSSLENYFVRINASDTDEFKKDIEMIERLKIKNIVIPKVDSAEMISGILQIVKADKIIVLIESFRSFKVIDELSGFNIFGLGLGLEDMLSELPYNNDGLPELINSIKFEFALKCLMNGLMPIDGITRKIFDAPELEKECIFARSSGYAGKFSVHPTHIPVINGTFFPSQDTVSWAEFIRNETGFVNRGYIKSASGEVITPPKIIKAKKILKYIKGEDE